MTVRRPFAVLALLALAAGSPAADPNGQVEGAASPWPDWAVGAVADRDILTPVELVVTNPEETALLQERAAARVPLVYRHDPAAGAAAVTRLEQDFFAAREQFRQDLAARFGRFPLTDRDLAGRDFASFAAEWVARWPGYPPGREVAAVWAAGGQGVEALQPLAQLVRRLQDERRIRESPVEPDAGLGPSDVLVVPADRIGASLSFAEAERLGERLPRAEFVSLDDVRAEAAQSLPDARLAAYVGRLLRANCAYDAALTRAERRQRTAGVASLDRYAPGQAIVRGGEVVTPAIRAALEQLRIVAPPDWLRAMERTAAPAPAPNPAPVAPTPAPAPDRGPDLWTLLVPGSILVLALTVLLLARRVRQTHQVVQHSTALTVMHQEAAGTGDQAERARVVERALRDATVQALFSQRQELSEQNRRAAEHLDQLEARIARLQPQIQAKLRAYEQRISELEQELAIVRAESRAALSEQLAETRRERDELLAGLT